ncbi:MAG TPA: hypothetical protein VGK36_08815 [Candidatus Angelobacter sp.]|jgi:hypothetical protein
MMNKKKIVACIGLCLVLAISAWAARTAITPITPKGPYPGTVNAGDLALTFTAADTTNLNSFSATGTEVLIVQNSDAASQTITLTTKPDQFGRSADIATYSMAAGTFAVFNFRNANTGWVQSDGNIYFQASTTTVKFAVIRVP